MTSPTKRTPACESPAQPHGVRRARLYPHGWFCNRHSPRGRRGLEDYAPPRVWPSRRHGDQHDPEHQEEPHDDDSAPTPDADAPGRREPPGRA